MSLTDTSPESATATDGFSPDAAAPGLQPDLRNLATPASVHDLTLPPDRRLAFGRGAFNTTLDLRHAGPRCLRLSYEWQGPADAPVLLVAGGISAHRHVAASADCPEPGWWPQQAGAGRALDTSRFRILAINWIGADGTLDAPIDSSDQADAIAAVLAHLDITKVAAFIGCSYGAMVGLQFAARHPSRVGHLLAISGGDRAHPYSSAWRGLQRRVARLGASEGGRREALSLARQLAMLSYRTPEEFAERFDAPVQWQDGNARFASEDYLDACGSNYVARTPLTAFLRLSESIDVHAVAPESVAVPTTLVAIDEDRLVPRHTLVELAERLPVLRRLHLLRSRYGHDAFLKEEAAIADIIRTALDDVLTPGLVVSTTASTATSAPVYPTASATTTGVSA